MTILESILLGAVQGISEFLPISSSGHLVVMKQLMDLKEVPIFFDVLLHVSTLVVVCIVFRKRLAAIVVALIHALSGKMKEEDRENIRLFWLVVLATAFTSVVGYLVSLLEPAEKPRLVSLLFLVTAAILIGAAFMHGKKGYREIGAGTAIFTGIAQGLGVFPGISRSGITISASLYSGMKRDKAGEYAFVLSIPAIIGALVFTLKDAATLSRVVSLPVLIIGLLASFVVGLFSLLLLLRMIRHGRLYLFSLYLIPLGIIGFLMF